MLNETIILEDICRYRCFDNTMSLAVYIFISLILRQLYKLCHNVTSSEVERSQSLYKTVEISPLHFVSVEMTLVLSPRAKSRGLYPYIKLWRFLHYALLRSK